MLLFFIPYDMPALTFDAVFIRSATECVHGRSSVQVTEQEEKGIEALLGRGWALTGDAVRAPHSHMISSHSS